MELSKEEKAALEAVKRVYQVYTLDSTVLLGLDLIGIIEESEALQAALETESLTEFFDKSRQIHDEENKLLLLASTEHTTVLANMDEELVEKERLYTELEEQKGKIEKQNKKLQATNKEQQEYVLKSEKLTRVYWVVVSMIVLVFFIFGIFSLIAFISLSGESAAEPGGKVAKAIQTDTLNAIQDLKELAFLILGTALGILTGFTATKALEKKQAEMAIEDS